MSFFEGPEKTLQLIFIPRTEGVSLRDIGEAEWSRLLDATKCRILQSSKSKNLNSYVLSESSLFVYDNRVLVKTCGTSSLLLILEPLLEVADILGLSLGRLCYFRKEFQEPSEQIFPHTSPAEESKYCRNVLQATGLLTKFFLVGDVDEDHCCLVTSERPTPEDFPRIGNTTLTVMMYGLERGSSKVFFPMSEDIGDQGNLIAAGERARVQSGITDISALKNASSCIFSDTLFNPCGYSMNALVGKNYATIHVTPQSSCSYASFETDLDMSDLEVQELLDEVVGIFRPSRLTVTTLGMAARQLLPLKQLTRCSSHRVSSRSGLQFSLTNYSNTK